mgnify:CR=1 FL=1
MELTIVLILVLELVLFFLGVMRWPNDHWPWLQNSRERWAPLSATRWCRQRRSGA